MTDLIPYWSRYKYVSDGYRNKMTVAQAIGTIFDNHSETINIWTMVCLMFQSTYMYCISDRTLPHLWLWISVILHSPFSIIFHVCMCCEHDLVQFLRKLDISFIYINSYIRAWSLSRLIYRDGTWILYMSDVLNLAVLFHSILNTRTITTDHAISSFTHLLPMGLSTGLVTAPLIHYVVRHGEFVSMSALGLYGTITSLVFSLMVVRYKFPEKTHRKYFRQFPVSSHNLMHVGAMMLHMSLYIFIIHVTVL